MVSRAVGMERDVPGLVTESAAAALANSAARRMSF